MTSWIPRAGVAAFLLASLGAPGWADTTAMRFSVKGDTAIAVFEGTSPTDACLRFFVSVTASDVMEKVSPGPRTSNVGTVLVVAAQDTCEGVTLLSGAGETAQQSLRIAGDLSTATLSTTVTVFDTVSLNSYHFAVDLTWTAVGPVETHHDKEMFRDPSLGLLINSQIRGAHVEAQATGTVVGLDQNFTPQPSSRAELQTQNSGIVVIELTR
jgi:hypothetical protein